MLRRLTLIMLLFTIISAGTLYAQDDESRAFYMGFTPFPHAIGQEAVDFAYERIAQDADLIVHHFDNGVPWTEALAGEPYHPNMMNDWRFRRSQIPDGHRLLVTMTPIHLMRDQLAPYRGEAEDMPLPVPFDSYAFDHPDVIQAFIAHCQTTIDFFQPDYFIFGIEVNLVMKLSPDLWDAYMVLHREVYNTLKAIYPDLSVMVSLTGHDLLPGYTDADHEDQMRALADVLDYTDVVAWSLYPYMTAYMTNQIPQDMFDDLAALADKPMAVAETGYPAQSFTVSEGVYIEFDSDETKQAEYITLLLEKAQVHEFLFVVNFVLRDYDDLWLAIGGREDLTIVWRDTGLYSETGDVRPALDIWREWLARPVQE